MRKPQTSEELARVWKQGKIDINTALRRHFKIVGIGPIDPAFLMFLPILIGYANMGLREKLIPVGEEQRTVAQIVEDLQLHPFLNDSEEVK